MVRAFIVASIAWAVSQVMWTVGWGTVLPDLHGQWLIVPLLAPPIAFAVVVFRKLRAVQEREAEMLSRSVVTRSGLRLLPADGTARAPIVVLESDPALIPKAELEFALERALPAPVERWALASQALQTIGGRPMDVLTFQSTGGQSMQLWFDISRSRLFS